MRTIAEIEKISSPFKPELFPEMTRDELPHAEIGWQRSTIHTLRHELTAAHEEIARLKQDRSDILQEAAADRDELLKQLRNR